VSPARDFPEARVAEPAVAVVVGDLLRLHEQVHMVGAQVVAQLQRLQQVEHLQHGEALRRRRGLVDGHAAIAAADRLAPIGLLRGEVAFAEHAAERGEALRHFALVEAGAAIRRDGLQRACERWISKDWT
jgi:hypothetical protein